MPTTSEVTAVVQSARRGDTSAWAALYELHQGDVYRALLANRCCHEDAMDLMQETFEQAWASLPRFEGRSSFRGWLIGIAYNVARGHRRANARLDRTTRGYADFRELTQHRDDLEDRHARTEAQAAVSSAMQLLPDGLRAAFRLRYLDGLSLANAAEVVGITPTNLGVRAHRAKAKVRAELCRAGISIGQVCAA